MPTPHAQQSPESETAMLTVAEAATKWKLSRQTIYRLASAGRIQSVRIGGSVRIVDQLPGLKVAG